MRDLDRSSNLTTVFTRAFATLTARYSPVSEVLIHVEVHSGSSRLSMPPLTSAFHAQVGAWDRREGSKDPRSVHPRPHVVKA